MAGGGRGSGASGSVNVDVAVSVLPPPAGVAAYVHVGGSGGGGAGGGGAGGAEGGMQLPSQSTMYSTYTLLPMYGFSSTDDVARVTNVYEPSVLGGSLKYFAHVKKPRPSAAATPSRPGLHLPCTG